MTEKIFLFIFMENKSLFSCFSIHQSGGKLFVFRSFKFCIVPIAYQIVFIALYVAFRRIDFSYQIYSIVAYHIVVAIVHFYSLQSKIIVLFVLYYQICVAFLTLIECGTFRTVCKAHIVHIAIQFYRTI